MKRSLDLKKFYLNNVKLLTILFLIFILLTVSDKSFADGIFNDIIGTFDTHLTGVGALLQKSATNLFLILAAIAIVWTGCELIMTKGDLSDFFAQFLKLIVVLGFFYYLVSGGGLALCKAFLESMSQLGGSAMGDSGASASSMVDKLIGLEGAINYDWESDLGALKSLAIFAVYLLIVIAGFVIVINLVLLWITALLCIYSGVIVLGFGSLGWTREIAINYFRQVANVCLQLLVVMVIFSIASNEMNRMIDANPKTTSVEQRGLGASNASMVTIKKVVVTGGLAMPHLIKLFAMTFLLAVCSYKVPPLVGNIIGGAGSGNMNIGIGHAIAVTAASAAAAAAVVTGGASLASSAAAGAGKGVSDTVDKMSKTATNKDSSMGLNGISGGGSGDSSTKSGSAFSDNKSSGGQSSGGQSSGGQSSGGQSSGGQSSGGQSSGGQSSGGQSSGGQSSGGQSSGGQSSGGQSGGGQSSGGQSSGGQSSGGQSSGGQSSGGQSSGGQSSGGQSSGGQSDGGQSSGGQSSGGQSDGDQSDGSSEASSDNIDSSSDNSSGSNYEHSGKNLTTDTGKFIASTARNAAIYGKDMLEIAASDNPAGASSIASHYSSGSGGNTNVSGNDTGGNTNVSGNDTGGNTNVSGNDTGGSTNVSDNHTGGSTNVSSNHTGGSTRGGNHTGGSTRGSTNVSGNHTGGSTRGSTNVSGNHTGGSTRGSTNVSGNHTSAGNNTTKTPHSSSAFAPTVTDYTKALKPKNPSSSTSSSVPDYKKGISNSNPNADTNINPNINPHRTGRDDYKKG